ncbi:MAG: cytochrome-c oxidase, cbb3-type subunit II [Caulobacterales bacterium]|nr:cytochrome-c oxidase, cbb3-type subunit II [Caulobacterales bacterium]
MRWHHIFEKHTPFLLLGTLFMVSIGGIVEIAPLFYLDNTIEEVEGVRPYSPLELKGREIYIREGCYVCHSQMVRPLRDEVERYGHYSLAAESMYDHPFQWGSKRTGPDLARVGGKYSDEWHQIHMRDPRAVVPESIMPPYAFLEEADLFYENIDKALLANRRVGVPYTDEMIASAKEDLEAQVDEFSSRRRELMAAYPGVQMRDFDGDRDRITELDAIIAYMQVLGTMVDFSTYEAEAAENLR